MTSVENWIKLQKETREKPEVRAMAKRLGCTPVDVVGACAVFWMYADSNMRDGFVPLTDRADVDEIVMRKGFADAIEAVGWARFADGGVHVPKADSHLGRGAKDRAEATARQHKSRDAKRLRQDSDENEDARQAVTDARDDSSRKSVNREEKSREDTPPPTPSRSKPKPSRQSKSARRKRATEEAEAIKALPEAWKPAIAAVRRIGPAEWVSAILTAHELEHPPDRVERFVAILDHNQLRFTDPAGALVSRLCNAETDPLKGWIVHDLADPTSAKPRAPDPEKERRELVREILARDRCTPGEAAERADAELAKRKAKGDAA